ncbi:MAG: hypothetical protein WBI20_06570 [Burkholderiaceae bacterium]
MMILLQTNFCWLKRALVFGLLSTGVFSIVGCKDRYQEGYDLGYAEGFSQAKIGVEKRCEERLDEEKKSCRDRSYSSAYSSGYSTEVCGGAGVTANGKHYDGGKTGCVRVYSDGRVVRY